MKNIIEMTEQNIDELFQNQHLLLVDFWAQWCAPCKDFAKVVEQIAPEYPNVMFAKVNIEEQAALASEFNIRSVPSVMILRDQVVVYAESGALGAAALKELLDQAKSLDPQKL